jgi:hypothetical protein
MTNFLTRSLLTCALVSAAGCYTDEPGAQYAGEEDDGNGDLVEISPGVEVVADYDEPIFFADDFYWVNRGGIWYSSGWYGGGWIRAEHPPARVVGIRDPGAYRHYRPAGYVAHERIRGGYASHAQYHTTHAATGGVHVRAAVRGHSGGGGGHHR